MSDNKMKGKIPECSICGERFHGSPNIVALANHWKKHRQNGNGGPTLKRNGKYREALKHIMARIAQIKKNRSKFALPPSLENSASNLDVHKKVLTYLRSSVNFLSFNDVTENWKSIVEKSHRDAKNTTQEVGVKDNDIDFGENHDVAEKDDILTKPAFSRNCKECGEVFSSALQALLHIKEHRDEIPAENFREEQSFTSQKLLLKCIRCCKEFPSFLQAREHSKVHKTEIAAGNSISKGDNNEHMQKITELCEKEVFLKEIEVQNGALSVFEDMIQETNKLQTDVKASEILDQNETNMANLEPTNDEGEFVYYSFQAGLENKDVETLEEVNKPSISVSESSSSCSTIKEHSGTVTEVKMASRAQDNKLTTISSAGEHHLSIAVAKIQPTKILPIKAQVTESSSLLDGGSKSGHLSEDGFFIKPTEILPAKAQVTESSLNGENKSVHLSNNEFSSIAAEMKPTKESTSSATSELKSCHPSKEEMSMTLAKVKPAKVVPLKLQPSESTPKEILDCIVISDSDDEDMVMTPSPLAYDVSDFVKDTEKLKSLSQQQTLPVYLEPQILIKKIDLPTDGKNVVKRVIISDSTSETEKDSAISDSNASNTISVLDLKQSVPNQIATEKTSGVKRLIVSTSTETDSTCSEATFSVPNSRFPSMKSPRKFMTYKHRKLTSLKERKKTVHRLINAMTITKKKRNNKAIKKARIIKSDSDSDSESEPKKSPWDDLIQPPRRKKFNDVADERAFDVTYDTMASCSDSSDISSSDEEEPDQSRRRSINHFSPSKYTKNLATQSVMNPTILNVEKSLESHKNTENSVTDDSTNISRQIGANSVTDESTKITHQKRANSVMDESTNITHQIGANSVMDESTNLTHQTGENSVMDENNISHQKEENSLITRSTDATPGNVENSVSDKNTNVAKKKGENSVMDESTMITHQKGKNLVTVQCKEVSKGESPTFAQSKNLFQTIDVPIEDLRRMYEDISDCEDEAQTKRSKCNETNKSASLDAGMQHNANQNNGKQTVVKNSTGKEQNKRYEYINGLPVLMSLLRGRDREKENRTFQQSNDNNSTEQLPVLTSVTSIATQSNLHEASSFSEQWPFSRQNSFIESTPPSQNSVAGDDIDAQQQILCKKPQTVSSKLKKNQRKSKSKSLDADIGAKSRCVSNVFSKLSGEADSSVNESFQTADTSSTQSNMTVHTVSMRKQTSDTVHKDVTVSHNSVTSNPIPLYIDRRQSTPLVTNSNVHNEKKKTVVADLFLESQCTKNPPQRNISKIPLQNKVSQTSKSISKGEDLGVNSPVSTSHTGMRKMNTSQTSVTSSDSDAVLSRKRSSDSTLKYVRRSQTVEDDQNTQKNAIQADMAFCLNQNAEQTQRAAVTKEALVQNISVVSSAHSSLRTENCDLTTLSSSRIMNKSETVKRSNMMKNGYDSNKAIDERRSPKRKSRKKSSSVSDHAHQNTGNSKNNSKERGLNNLSSGNASSKIAPSVHIEEFVTENGGIKLFFKNCVLQTAGSQKNTRNKNKTLSYSPMVFEDISDDELVPDILVVDEEGEAAIEDVLIAENLPRENISQQQNSAFKTRVVCDTGGTNVNTSKKHTSLSKTKGFYVGDNASVEDWIKSAQQKTPVSSKESIHDLEDDGTTGELFIDTQVEDLSTSQEETASSTPASKTKRTDADDPDFSGELFIDTQVETSSIIINSVVSKNEVHAMQHDISCDIKVGSDTEDADTTGELFIDTQAGENVIGKMTGLDDLNNADISKQIKDIFVSEDLDSTRELFIDTEVDDCSTEVVQRFDNKGSTLKSSTIEVGDSDIMTSLNESDRRQHRKSDSKDRNVFQNFGNVLSSFSESQNEVDSDVLDDIPEILKTPTKRKLIHRKIIRSDSDSSSDSGSKRIKTNQSTSKSYSNNNSRGDTDDSFVEAPVTIPIIRKKATARKSIRNSSRKHPFSSPPEPVPPETLKQRCIRCHKLVSSAQEDLYNHWANECKQN